MPLHPQLSSGRWASLSLAEQLANVGSEVERSIRAHESGRPERFTPALDRALELFDLTARDARWSGPRRKEILRARGEFVRLFFDAPPAPDQVSGLRRYFLAFAILARRGQGSTRRPPG